MTRYYHADPQEAFEHAIFNHTLSDESQDQNWAGYYMYMESNGTHDLFKHRETRQYVKSPLICAM